MDSALRISLCLVFTLRYTVFLLFCNSFYSIFCFVTLFFNVCSILIYWFIFFFPFHLYSSLYSTSFFFVPWSLILFISFVPSLSSFLSLWSYVYIYLLISFYCTPLPAEQESWFVRLSVYQSVCLSVCLSRFGFCTISSLNVIRLRWNHVCTCLVVRLRLSSKYYPFIFTHI